MGSYQLHIVLADDDQDDRMLFEDAFNEVKMAHSLDMVNDGYALMSYLALAEKLPDIIFLDLNMPGKPGKECLKEIRGNAKFREVAVAIYSTSGSIVDIEDTFVAGANIYVKKPNDFSALKKMLSDVMSISKLYLTDGLNRENFMLNL